ncbi:hypothetical protein [Terricaulis sp.]|uniref:hypothetical protein n=1 Tax=Terricaulis sp. TaxID=2768686 RepID=UPI003784B946
MTDETPPPISNPQDPKRTGHRWLDLTVALSALLISAVSIFVAYSSNQSMERIARASSWPFIQLGSGNAADDGAHELSFGVANVGAGPARLYTYDVQIDDKPLPPGGHLLTRMLQACCNEEFSAATARSGSQVSAMGSEMSQPMAERFIAPNTEVLALRWPRTEDNAALWAALDRARQGGRISVSACYCSVFDDCWVAETSVFPPREVASCDSAALARARPQRH